VQNRAGRVTREADRHEVSTTLLAFAQSTCEAAAELAGWDRAALERPVLVYRSAEEQFHPVNKDDLHSARGGGRG